MNRLTRARLLVVAAVLVVLELACRTGLISSYSLIPPSEMVVAMVQMLRSGELTAEILQTVLAVFISVAAAVVVGILIAIVLHSMPRLRQAIEPVLVTYYSIPIFVFYPLFIVLFGLNDVPKVVIGFMLAVVTMIASTLNGLDRVPRVLRKTGRVLHLSRMETIREVVLPSAALSVFNGVKLAIAHAFVGVLAAEFILSTGGLGYQIAYAFHDFDNRKMYGIMLLLLIIVAVVNAFLMGWERYIRQRRGLS
jgi:NitT/TauT family transport system permease protein